jgi:plastocyanin
MKIAHPRRPWAGRLFGAAWRTALALSFGLVAHAATHQVSMEDAIFLPQELAITVGDTVEWIANEGGHAIAEDEELFDSTLTWDTVPLKAIFRYTFNVPGVFLYHCPYHGSPDRGGMSGFVVVSPGGSENQPPLAPVNQLPANGATNQPATPTLRAGAFSDFDADDFHKASQWVVRRVSDNAAVFDSGTDTVNRILIGLPLGALANGTAYWWQVRYQDGRDAWSEYSAPTTFTTLVPVAATGVGLRATYYNDPGFAGSPVATTNAVVDFNWGQDRPHRRITANEFAARWEGSLLPEFTEEYQIQIQYRGRARLWVNDTLLVDAWEGCAFGQTRRASVPLVGGQLAKVRLDYAADASGARAALRWTSPSLPLEPVPTLRLFPPNP